MMSYLLTIITLAILYLVNHTQLASIHEKQMNNNPLTSHVLDTSRGVPAACIPTILYKLNGDGWTKLVERKTNEDGRLGNLLEPSEFQKGVYKFHFDTKSYYDALSQKTFYPYVEIVFEIEKPEEHYHVPLLLSPYGYSTYRGS